MNDTASNIMVPQRMQRQEVIQRGDLSPMQMISLAVQQGADIAKIEKLMDLRDRWESTEARKAFVAAMAAFKAEPILILKTKKVDIQGGAKFAHATLADVVDGVCSTLSRHGLSHKWETKQDAAGAITVACVITHVLGHSERVELTGKPDDSGRKNQIQQVASTVTYLERYTLMAACGLAAKDTDTDGRDEKERPKSPEGYDKWQADMGAKADEGSEALQAAWAASPANFRALATLGGDWWPRMKAKAKAARHDG